jgi:hypothetical protein
MAPRMFSDNEHLSQMGFTGDMALETVLVSALFLADLTVPAQLLKSLGLHLVGEVLGCSN